MAVSLSGPSKVDGLLVVWVLGLGWIHDRQLQKYVFTQQRLNDLETIAKRHRNESTRTSVIKVSVHIGRTQTQRR
jgi:hypothetical protein